MLSLPPSTKIFLCSQAVDMRKSFDALSGLIQTHFGQNPLNGHLFVFFSKSRDRMKILFGTSTDLCSITSGSRADRSPGSATSAKVKMPRYSPRSLHSYWLA